MLMKPFCIFIISFLSVCLFGGFLFPFLFLTPQGLAKIVRSGLIVIAHVQNQHHFVLVTGFQEPNKFLVNDPFYPKTSYTIEEIHDFLFYDIQ
jgi:hypothetical protein